MMLNRQDINTIEDMIKGLPPEFQQEVFDFVEFLQEKKFRRRQKKLRMTWAGALKEFRDQFTSIELQKKAIEWWGD